MMPLSLCSLGSFENKNRLFLYQPGLFLHRAFSPLHLSSNTWSDDSILPVIPFQARTGRSLSTSSLSCSFPPLSFTTRHLSSTQLLTLCQVLSPMQAILDYELSHSIPPGWVNHSISKNSPHGFWHRLERGELPMDSKFFAGFSEDLHNPSLWRNFYLEKARKADPSLPKEVVCLLHILSCYLLRS